MNAFSSAYKTSGSSLRTDPSESWFDAWIPSETAEAETEDLEAVERPAEQAAGHVVYWSFSNTSDTMSIANPIIVEENVEEKLRAMTVALEAIKEDVAARSEQYQIVLNLSILWAVFLSFNVLSFYLLNLKWHEFLLAFIPITIGTGISWLVLKSYNHGLQDTDNKGEAVAQDSVS